MPELAGGMARYDLNNPEDLAVLIDRGLIWKGGPKAIGRAIAAIRRGDVPRPTKNVPDNVNAYLDRLGIQYPEGRNEDVVGPEAETSAEDANELPSLEGLL